MAKVRKVCLDAGHYGNYNRSPVVSGYYESVRMWKLTELLAAELTARGISVVKTRNNQKNDLALISRGKKAKGCDLFISLHSNASDTKTTDYPVAIVYQKKDKTTIDERSADIGLQLAKVVQKVMGTTQAARTMTRKSSSDRDGNGKLDDEYFGVLHGARSVNVPGIILEHSFHTNQKSTDWLMSDANLKKLAQAEAECIAEWLGVESKPVRPAKDYLYRVRVTIKDLNIRSGPGTKYASKGYIKPGVYRIKSENGIWLELYSGAGWISSKYVTKLTE